MHLPKSPRLTVAPDTEVDRTFLESCWDDLDLRRYLCGAMPVEKRDRIFDTFLASDSCWVLRLDAGTPVGPGIPTDRHSW
jgi:hypothetical protein